MAKQYIILVLNQALVSARICALPLRALGDYVKMASSVTLI
jgi:hypothetical protein